MYKTETAPHSIMLIAPQFSKLTAANAQNFKQHLLDLVEAGHNRLVIDLAAVGIMDASGISALVALIKRIGNRGQVSLCGLNDYVMQLFRITRMDSLFAIHTNSADALEALES
jgi:anti-sigma B factor antagonist